jgi:PAS domain-containing protein
MLLLSQEAVGYIAHEVNFHLDLSPSVLLDNADSYRKQSAFRNKCAGIADISKYNIVIHELATTAFRSYIKSKFYKGWRAHESGSVQSLRGRLIESMSDCPDRTVGAGSARSNISCDSFLRFDGKGTIVVTNSYALGPPDDSNTAFRICSDIDDKWASDRVATRRTSVSNTASCDSVVRTVTECPEQLTNHLQSVQTPVTSSEGPTVPLLNFSSFAEAAFAVSSNDPRDCALLLGSTWLATLVAGVESLSIGFSLLSVPEPHLTKCSDSPRTAADVTKDDLKFVYVNHQFERDFGYSKRELIGRTSQTLFCSSYQDCTPDASLLKTESEFLNILLSGLDSCIALPLRRKNGRHTRTFVCTKALYNQHGHFRYVVCMSVNIPVDCDIYYGRRSIVADVKPCSASGEGSSASAAEPSRKANLMAQFNSDALVELLELLPTEFLDDYVLQSITTIIE